MPKIAIMKKIIFCNIYILFFCALVFAQDASTTPKLAELAGIWENSGRFIAVENDSLLFVLKTFYGFYYDVSGRMSANLVTGENGETILSVNYANQKTNFLHPISVINDKLFLDFYCKGSAFENVALLQNADNLAQDSQSSNASYLSGFWRACGNVDGIELDIPECKREVVCYYFTANDVYCIRYWRADVEYEQTLAECNDGDVNFVVDKHLKIGDTVYTCTVGRGKTVRNLVKYPYRIENLDGKDYLVIEKEKIERYPFYAASDGNLVAFAEPYLTKSSIANLDDAIKEHNAKTHNPFKNPLDVFLRTPAWEEKLNNLSAEELEPFRTYNAR